MRWSSLIVPLTHAIACGGAEPTPPPAGPPGLAPETAQGPGQGPAHGPGSGIDAPALAERAGAVFAPLPDYVARGDEARSEPMIELGRMLYFDPRISLGQDLSCNSCHRLDKGGVDGEPTSPGHKGVRGGRNSPTVYNAALHVAQFWDGREPDVEAQALGPVLNPVEMAMGSEEDVVAKLKAVPGYVAAFEAAFPDQPDPISGANFGRAIGAFERGLLTPSPFDAFLKGDHTALSTQQMQGLQTYLEVGCTTCHNGAAVGGAAYFKLGLVKPYDTDDVGRFEVTKDEADRQVFKVPSLRNVTRTGPYFHDGSVTGLDQAVKLMGTHQLGRELTPGQVGEIIAFLDALTGTPDPAYITEPALPEAGPSFPAPDAN
jgi:cytochrome c peroxidase